MTWSPARMSTAAVIVGICAALVAVGVLLAGPGVLAQSHGDLADGQTMPMPPADFESSERMSLPGSNATVGTGTPSVDPGQATSASADRLIAQYEMGMLEEDIDSTQSSDRQLERIRADVRTIEGELLDTMAAEEAAMAAFAAGEIDAATFLAELSYQETRAQTIQYRLDHLSDTVQGITSPLTQEDVRFIRGEISQLNMEASTLEGPVRGEVGDVIRGQWSPDRGYHVQSSEDGYVIANLDGTVFTREIYVVANRDRTASNSFTHDDIARDRTAELYPWTVEEAIGTESTLRGGIYWTSIDHPHGTTTTQLDGGTEFPFREVHELDLFTVPTVTALEEVSDGIAVDVERTYPGGPAAITLSDADSVDPLSDVDVQVDDRAVGMTNDDGTLWVVAPDESMTVTATVEGTTIEVTVPIS